MSENDDVDVVVSIVTWRAAALTVDCLAALDPEIRGHRTARAIIVDNDSQDGTFEAVRDAIVSMRWGDWAQIVRAPCNGGFAYGNNFAIRIAARTFPGARYIMMLNPDAFIEAGSIRSAVSFLQANPSVGIVGGLCTDRNGMKAPSAFRFPSVIGEFVTQAELGVVNRLFPGHVICMPFSETPMPTDWVVGALSFIRREVFEAVQAFDEGYFLYYEETDFCLRARQHGWSTWHVPGIRALHLEGELTGVREGPGKARLPQYWFDSRRRYFILNHGISYAIAADLAAIVGALISNFICLFSSKTTNRPPHFIKDLARHGVLGRWKADIGPRKTGW
jgi:N-acetylglucosaminyl-diphospho-decaprenol L-rhamnosyltransferase